MLLLLILQAGIYLIELLDEFCGGIPFIIIGLFMCSALAWIYNVRHFCTDIKQMTGSKVGLWWRVMWCFFTPVIIVVSLVLSLHFTVLLKCILLCNKCPQSNYRVATQGNRENRENGEKKFPAGKNQGI